MKKILILWMVLFAFIYAEGQNGTHEHDGFYLSMSIGPLFGNISNDVTGIHGPYTAVNSGTSGQFDFKIGGAISKNLILHATLLDDYLPGPKVITTQNGYSVTTKMPDAFAIGESLLGVGMTFYSSSNLFFSSSVGLGNFSIANSEDSKNDFTTENGLGFQIKMGKEWWISKNWAFGLGLSYHNTNTTHDTGAGEQEKLNSSRFGILFNTTFN